MGELSDDEVCAEYGRSRREEFVPWREPRHTFFDFYCSGRPFEISAARAGLSLTQARTEWVGLRAEMAERIRRRGGAGG
jgi:hypothetical protein